MLLRLSSLLLSWFWLTKKFWSIVNFFFLAEREVVPKSDTSLVQDFRYIADFVNSIIILLKLIFRAIFPWRFPLFKPMLYLPKQIFDFDYFVCLFRGRTFPVFLFHLLRDYFLEWIAPFEPTNQLLQHSRPVPYYLILIDQPCVRLVLLDIHLSILLCLPPSVFVEFIEIREWSSPTRHAILRVIYVLQASIFCSLQTLAKVTFI